MQRHAVEVEDFLKNVYTSSYKANLYERDDGRWTIELFGRWPDKTLRGHDRSPQDAWRQIREISLALFHEEIPDLPGSVDMLPTKAFPVEFVVWGRAARLYTSEQHHLIFELAPAYQSSFTVHELLEGLIATYGGAADNVIESPTKENPLRFKRFFSKSCDDSPLHAIGFFSREPTDLLIYQPEEDTWVLEFQTVEPYSTPEFRSNDKGVTFKTFLKEILGAAVQEKRETWQGEEPTETWPFRLRLFSRTAEAFVDDKGHWIVRLPCTQGFRTLQELVHYVGGMTY